MTTRRFTAILIALLIAISSMSIASAQDGGAVNITLNGDSIAVDGNGATVSGSTVTITAAGVYNLSGTLADGQVVVDTEDSGTVNLRLNGVAISSSTSAAIYVKNAESTLLSIEEGTQNSLSDAITYVYASAEEDEPDAALFSDDDLIIDGTGRLTIEANYNHAIVGKDSLTITGTPMITINAVNDGINVNDLLTIDGGVFSINAGDDGLQSDQDLTVNGGSITITAVGDGIHSEYNLQINNGTIDILNSNEGIEGAYITLNGGDIQVLSSDDGINVSAADDGTTPTSGLYLHINGGNVLVDAEGDGLDSNGSIEMTGGVVIVNGPTMSMNGATDYDGTFNITGGVLVAVGSASMPQALSATSGQNSLLINFDSALSAGTLLHIQSSADENLLTFASTKTIQSLAFSSPELAIGTTYDVYFGGSSDAASQNGLYEEGTYTPGTLQTSFTISDTVTQVGNIGRGFGRGNGGNGGGGRP